MPAEILTATGRTFDLERPDNGPFDIQAIAHALSHICRFSGHVREFYSVAQHSVLVSQLLPPHLAMQGLLHDAAEAYLGDLVSPLKRMLSNYRRLEERVEEAIFRHFGLVYPPPSDVKAADMVLLATEQRDLMPSCAEAHEWETFYHIKPLPQRIVPLEPLRARVQFLERFEEILDAKRSQRAAQRL
jgi:5'-deoxynucleotidase YfbR-like HD superfamily hydrolase